MLNLILWGTGGGSAHTQEYLSRYIEPLKIVISAYVDNNPKMWGDSFLGKEVIAPGMLGDYEYDYIVIASVKYEIIKEQCIKELDIPEEKVLSKREIFHKVFSLYQYHMRYYVQNGFMRKDISKIVVYTANFGNYDDLKDPLYIDENIRYVCFTDNMDFKSSVWEVHYVDTKDEEVLPLAVRYYKFFPYKIFPEYEVSIWVDSKFLIVGNLLEYVEAYKKNNSMLCFPHYERDCIYDEAVECISIGKGEPIMIGGQIFEYYKESYPKNNGLYEGGCLVRWHRDKKLQMVMQKWWEEIHRYSWRDQISLPYICWKYGFEIDISDLDIEKNNYLEYLGHN